MFARCAVQRAETTLLSSRQGLARPARLYSTPSKRASGPAAAFATSPAPTDVYPSHLYTPSTPSTSNAVMESFLNQPRSYTFLPSLRPIDSDSGVNAEWYGETETQDTLSIINACLHNTYDVPRAMSIFKNLRERWDKRPILDAPIYNAFLEAYLIMATENELENAQTWFEHIWKLFNEMRRPPDSVVPNHTTYAILALAQHRLPKELASVSPFDYRDLLSEILSHKLEIERIVVDRIFSDSEEAAAVIKAFSRAAIQLNLPQVVSVLGQTEALGMTHPDILDTVPDAKPVLKRIVQRSSDGSEEKEVEQVPFNINNLRRHLSQVNFARRIIPDDLAARQKLLEESVYEVAVERLKHESEEIEKLGLTTGFPRNLRSWMWEWHTKLTTRLESEIHKIQAVESRRRPTGGRPLSQYLFLVKPERLSLLTIMEVMSLHGSGGVAKGMKTTRLLLTVGRAVEMEYKAQMCRTHNISLPSLKHAAQPGYFSNLGYSSLLERRLTAARLVTDNEAWTAKWTQVTRSQIGGLLIDALMDVAKVVRTGTDINGETITEEQPAFYHGYEYTHGHKLGTIRLNDEIANAMEKDSLHGTIHPRHLPMLVPPRPWVAPESGGYYYNRTQAMRYKDCVEQASYMRHASAMGNVELIYAGLDVLGSTPWVINQKIFDVVLKVWNTGEGLGKLPPSVYPVPEPELPADHTAKEKSVYLAKLRVWHQEKANNHSKRCSVNYKIEIARSLLGDKIYQPHNLDFRGRAYPIPPHLNHIGDDLSRGLLKFAESKPLGERGLRWLKIHLANLSGYDKANFEERVLYVEERLDDIFDSATQPLTGNGWWMKAEDPWQCLATCIELHAALTSPDPHAFMSSQPVHQDGTCNGLQHYAALGGDSRGAQQVNLAAGERPSDVYTYVAKMVEAKIAKDVEKGDPTAKALMNRVSRKVVKQTVMTTVYGVTYIGAKDQIAKQIKALEIFNEEDSWAMSSYLAKEVLACIGDLFTGAKDIMNWLNICARLISRAIPEDRIPEAIKEYNEKQGLEVTHLPLDRLKKEQLTSVVWTTPLGLPIVQPYRKTKKRQIMTKVQTVYISDPNSINEVNAMKQASAFPPNFIHSLDATHMMLSALECQTQGLTFAAVHDSYWTHACSVDPMSVIIRDTFIALHSSDVLGKLREEFMERYKGYKIPVAHMMTASMMKGLKETGVDLCLGDDVSKDAIIEDDEEEEVDIKLSDDLDAGEFDDEEEVEAEVKPKKKRKYRKKSDTGALDKVAGRFMLLTDVLPPVPQKGDFRVEAIKASQYFFS